MYLLKSLVLPCTRLKDHVQTLTEAEQAELHFVPLKTASGSRTALAEELSVDLTPTLVVVHEEVSCKTRCRWRRRLRLCRAIS